MREARLDSVWEKFFTLVLAASFALSSLPLASQSVSALGLLNSPPVPHLHGTLHGLRPKSKVQNFRRSTWHLGKAQKKAKIVKAPVILPPPQNFVDKLSARTLVTGVTYKTYRGPLSINVVDVDTMNAPVKVRPVLAGETFNHLADVRNHAQKINALAAVNANYFKKDGTPLGTLIINGEWLSGSLFNRVSLGIARSGYVRIDCVETYGTLETSNPEVKSCWINSINQPRRHGSHLIAYTRRWGNAVHIPYEGALVAVNAQGEVVDTGLKDLFVPLGGYVLSDTKGSAISHLQKGDIATINWRTKPDLWSDVTQAVSGGPLLLKNGEVYLDLKEEHFRPNWTGRQIQARTAVGVTAYNHLILCTVEGPHTLWDMAKLLQKLGCVEAMNLDGGGSTTMVVAGKTVTRNANAAQRRVASSLAIVLDRQANQLQRSVGFNYEPNTNLTDFSAEDKSATAGANGQAEASPQAKESSGREADSKEVSSSNVSSNELCLDSATLSPLPAEP